MSLPIVAPLGNLVGEGDAFIRYFERKVTVGSGNGSSLSLSLSSVRGLIMH